MGRDIGVLIRDRKTKKILVDSMNDCDEYVCGRDDATNYVSMICDTPSEPKEEEAHYMDESYAVPDYCDISSDAEFSKIKEELKRFLAKDEREIQKAKDELEDLREARRHAPNYDAFCSFGEGIEYAYNWLEEENCSRAGHLINILDMMKEKFDQAKEGKDVELLLYCSE